MLQTDTDLATHLRLAVMRLSRRLRHESASDRVTPSMLAALSTIDRHRAEPMTIGDLAAAEQVSPPSMTRIVGHLEEQSLIQRQPDPVDRRITRLAVTAEGTRTLAEIRSRKHAFLAERLSGLTDDERGALAAALPILERLSGEAGVSR